MFRQIGKYKLVVILLLVVALFGCDNLPKEQHSYRIGFSQCTNDEWRGKMNRDMLREAMLYDNISLNILTANGDNNQQIEDIRYFIESGVDLLVVSPNEAVAITPAVEEAYNKGIPVIVVDRNVLTDCYTAFVGANNYQIGQAVGGYVRGLLPRGGKVVEITGLMGSTPAIERHQGFLNVIRNNPKIEMLCSEDAKWIEDNAYSQMLAILSEEPEIDVVFAHNDIMAYGAYRAAKSMGREKGIKFLGIDAMPGEKNGVGLVSQGIFEATFMYPSGVGVVIRTALDILEGREFQREITLNTAIIDKTNVKVMEMQSFYITEQEVKIEQLNERVGAYLDSYSSQRTIIYMGMLFIFLVVIMLIVLASALKSKNRLNEKLLKQNQDILEQKSQLETQRDQLIELSRQVEEATQAKLVFFTNISHEFRTPLTLIADPLNRLCKENLSESEREYYLGLISRNVNILLRLVNQILDFRKYENGKLKLSFIEVDFASKVAEWNDSFIPIFKRKRIEMHTNIATNENLMILLDEEKIEQVYYNLLSNAFKYTPEGGEISVYIDRVVEGSVAYVQLKMNNSGAYIPSDKLEQIFDRFYQIEGNSFGSGIGLAIVKAFVELHQGTVFAHSDQQNGTTITVQIPQIERPSDGSIEGLTPSILLANNIALSGGEGNGEEHISTKHRLLVVDDNDDIRSYIRQLFTADYEVLEANNGIVGLEVARHYVPDVILMDVMMPGLNGLECCQRLKADILTCHIPIIMLTARSVESQRAEGYQYGADSYITKPFSSEVLSARIRNLLEARRRVQQAVVEGEPLVAEELIDMDRDFMDKLNEYIEANMANSQIDVEELCTCMAMSRMQLYRKIKMLTDYSPNEYVRISRLRKAKELLSTTQLSVAEICYRTGFSSPSYFSKCFKSFAGELPSDFQRNHKKDI